MARGHDLPLLRPLLARDGACTGGVCSRGVPPLASRDRDEFRRGGDEPLGVGPLPHLPAAVERVGLAGRVWAVCGAQFCGVAVGVVVGAGDEALDAGGAGWRVRGEDEGVCEVSGRGVCAVVGGEVCDEEGEGGGAGVGGGGRGKGWVSGGGAG